MLNDLRMKSGARPDRVPTVRDLMRHTSGLAYTWEFQDAEVRASAVKANLGGRMPYIDGDTLLGAVVALPLAAQPGTRFRYGYSSDVLGMIVAKLDGVALGQALKARIFEPLGMHETGFEVPATGHARLASAYASDAAWHGLVPGIGMRKSGQPWMESGGGGLVSTLGDYACFARLLANGGRAGGERLLAESLFAQMRRNQLPEGADGPFTYTGPGFGFGLGLAVRLDWGPAAMPCAAGEMAWSGISGTALFVHPDEHWFALAFTSNMASRMTWLTNLTTLASGSSLVMSVVSSRASS
jgi:CubicO group peptidase (beta-lactamase class C family)